MSSASEISNPRAQRGPLVGLVVAGLLFAIAIIATASIPVSSDLIIWTVGPAFLFAVVSLTLHWLIAGHRRLLLLGRYPILFGMVKLAGFIGVAALLLLCVGGLMIGGSFGQRTLAAFIRGMVAFAVMTMIANGLLSLLVVSRRLRGTLSETSRESRP